MSGQPSPHPSAPAQPRPGWALPLLLLLLPCLPLNSQPYTALVAFGDSLTDTWNEPSADPVTHFDGRWSNGPLWVEYLSTRLGFIYVATNNYAHSGAQCNDTYQQVLLAPVHPDPDHTLYVVWAGGNDFLQEYDTLLLDTAAWTAHIHQAIGNLSNSIVSLCDRGARHLLVPNTVDLTAIPVVNAYLLGNPLAGFLRTYFRARVQDFNRELLTALQSLRTTYPDRQILSCDVFAALGQALAQPALYGFTETLLDALTDTSLLDKSFHGPGERYVFWDPIHPTTRAHAVIADWFQAIVAPAAPSLTLSHSGAGLQLSLTGTHAGTTYRVDSSPDLVSWQPLTNLTGFPELPASVQLPAPIAETSRFFRTSLAP